MEFFNFVETFFFISLAITFVLIMMLVYHFKERLSNLEKKTNTMFEILHTVIKEVNLIRNSLIPKTDEPISKIFSNVNSKIIVSDDDADEDDEDDEDEENFDHIQDFEAYSKENNEVKRINIEFNSKNNIDIESINEDLEVTKLEELDTEELDTEELDNKELDPEELYENNTEEQTGSTESILDSYKKMDINSLRSLIITKGIKTDTKKMKKNDLIKLLEQTA